MSDSDSPPGERPGDGTRDRIRKAGIAATALVVLGAVAYLGAALLLQSLLDPATVAGWAEPRMERTLNRDVEIGGVELSVFPGLGAEIRDLRIASPEGLEAPELASVRSVRLGVALWPLLQRRVEVDEVVMEGAEVRLVVAPDGRSNFGDFAPAADGAADPGGRRASPFSLRVRQLRLQDAAFLYDDRAGNRRAELRDVSGRVGLTEAGPGWALDGSAEAGSLRTTGIPAGDSLRGLRVALRAEGRTDTAFRALEIRSGRLEVGELSVDASGRVDSLRSPVRRVDLRLAAERVELREAAALAGVDPAARAAGAEGRLDLDLRLRGGLGSGMRPDVTGLVTLREGVYAPEGEPALASALQGELELTPDSALLRSLRGRVLGGSLEAGGAAALDTAAGFRGRVTAEPRLERWSRDAEGLDAAGTLGLDLELRGRMGSPGATRSRGTVTLEGVRLRRSEWRGAVGVPSGMIRLEGDRARVAELPLTVGSDTLRISGRLERLFSHLADGEGRPTVDADIRGSRLDLETLYPRDPADSVSFVRVALAHVGGRSVGGRPPAEVAAERGLSRPGPLPARGEVRAEIGELLWGPWRLGDASGRLVLGDSLALRGGSFRLLGGQATAELAMELGGGAARPFAVGFSLEDASGSDVARLFLPGGRLLSGRTALRLRAEGALDTLLLPDPRRLQADGRLQAREGRLAENPVTTAAARALSFPGLRAPAFADLALPFRIRGDSVLLEPSTLRADSVSIRLDGALRLGGGLGLSAGVRLPRALLGDAPVPGAAGRGLQQLLGDDGSGTVELGLRIAGTTRQPDVQLELPGARGPDRARVREEVKETLEERARGALDRLLGGRKGRADSARDTASATSDTAAGRDTAGAPGSGTPR
jgi:uncharacterized protein involved in outer membrane biogenesis